jgi:thiol-disulfide isomerase/thioredoxin
MTQQLWAVTFVVCLLSSCASTVGTKTEVVEVGWLQRSVLDKPELHQFKARYDTVALEENLVGLIHNVNAGVDFLVFFGTWCGDSRRELPHFLKIADQCGIESSRIRLYGLDRSKKSNDGLSDQYHVERVPTFIFLKNGSEVGRITEKPNTTLEADMLSILASAQQK